MKNIKMFLCAATACTFVMASCISAFSFQSISEKDRPVKSLFAPAAVSGILAMPENAEIGEFSPITYETVTASTFAKLKDAVTRLSSQPGGGIVYVDAKTLDGTSQLALEGTAGNPIEIVGVEQDDGTWPVLDFSVFRDDRIGTEGRGLEEAGDESAGIRITGSNYTLKNLIIQKAPDNGIQIKGDQAGNNRIENCIVRYNNAAGIQISSGAYANEMRFLYSYRNCDVYAIGGNANGFAPQLRAGPGNTFYGCYAWDNSDDGWDAYDKDIGGYTDSISYEESACWNNGNPDVFTGKYDFELGNALDRDLFLVELIQQEDPGFAGRYQEGEFILPETGFLNTSAGTLSLDYWTGISYEGSPNGFKFGSAYADAELTRTVRNCLAVDHAGNGFDNNNSACTGTFENVIAFDNRSNYHLPIFTLAKWENAIGFDGSAKDRLPDGYQAAVPDDDQQVVIRDTVNATVREIISKCRNDIIPGEVYFDIYP